MASASESKKSVEKSASQQNHILSPSSSSSPHSSSKSPPTVRTNNASTPKLPQVNHYHVSSLSTASQPAHSVIVTSSGDGNPARVLGWKTSKTFSKTMSSIEVSPPSNCSSVNSNKVLLKQQSMSSRTYHLHHGGSAGGLASGSGASGGMNSGSNSGTSGGGGGGGVCGGGGGIALSASQPRAAAIRIHMAESVGPSAYSLSLQQRNASDQWKLLKNRLLRKKSTEENETPASFSEVVIDRMRQMRRLSPHQHDVTGSPAENGIVCRTNELKKLLKSESGDNSGRNSTRSSFDANTASATSTASVTCVTSTVTSNTASNSSNSANVSCNPQASSFVSSSSPPIVICEADASDVEVPSSPLLSSSSSAVESTVKWDESNTLDAAVLGDAIQDFLKRLQCSSPTKVSGEKKVSFR